MKGTISCEYWTHPEDQWAGQDHRRKSPGTGGGTQRRRNWTDNPETVYENRHSGSVVSCDGTQIKWLPGMGSSLLLVQSTALPLTGWFSIVWPLGFVIKSSLSHKFSCIINVYLHIISMWMFGGICVYINIYGLGQVIQVFNSLKNSPSI